MLTLELKRTHAIGIYGPTKDQFPDRMSLLHPGASSAFNSANTAAGGNIILSDMFRSPESSLEAVAQGKGAQPPGYSAHNFGLAVDVAIDQTCSKMGITYHDLLQHMQNYGWYCYRRDGLRGSEAWHLNWLGDQAQVILPQLTIGRWAWAAESIIQHWYGAQLELSPPDIQTALKKLRMYSGAIDGILGPLSQRAIEVFGRAWQTPTTIESAKFQRTLAIVSAEQSIQEA